MYAATDRVLALGYSGDTAAALDLAGTLAAEAAATGNPSVLGWVSYATGETLMAADPARAATLLDEAAALARSVGNRYLGGVALVSAASLHARQGRHPEALRRYREAVGFWHSGGNLVQHWTTARGVVELLVGMSADEQAATLLGALTGSATAAEPYGDDVERLAVARATLAERLGPARLEAAIRAGAAVGDDRATAFVLELIDQALSSRPA